MMPARIPDSTVREIIARLDIVEVIGEYVELKRQGQNYVGLCPFHSEKTPSFSVSPSKQMFYCFGCGVGGNVLSFVMKKENLPFREAVESLAVRAGVRLPATVGAAAFEREGIKAKLERINHEAEQFYHRLLTSSPAATKARQYLKKRGLGPEAIERFRLGYAPPDWDQLVRHLRRHYSGADLEKAGLAVPQRQGGGYYDRFRDRIMFPILGWRGEVIGFGGRSLSDDALPKYLNSPETPLFHKGRALYALSWARASIRSEGYAVIVEGYMDALACHQAGIANVVASLGTALTREQAQMLRQVTERVVIAYDGDAAGQAATQRGLGLLAEAGLEVRVATMEAGKDPDDVIRSQGAEAFRQALTQALPLMEYNLKRAQSTYDIRSPQGKIKATRALLPYLAQIASPLERGVWIRRWAELASVNEDDIYRELQKYPAQMHKNGTGLDNNRDKGWFRQKKSTYETAVRQILLAVIREPHLWGRVQEVLGSASWAEGVYGQIAQAIQEELSSGATELNPATLLNRINDEAAQRALVESAFQDLDNQPMEDVVQGFDDYLRVIRLTRTRQRIAELEQKVKLAESANDQNQLRTLIKELSELQVLAHTLRA